MAEEARKERGDQAQELTTQGKEVVAEYYEQSRNRSSRGNSNLKPGAGETLQSLLIAAGVGLLFGLLRRR